MRGMGTGMMVACALFGLLLFIALLEFVILEDPVKAGIVGLRALM